MFSLLKDWLTSFGRIGRSNGVLANPMNNTFIEVMRYHVASEIKRWTVGHRVLLTRADLTSGVLEQDKPVCHSDSFRQRSAALRCWDELAFSRWAERPVKMHMAMSLAVEDHPKQLAHELEWQGAKSAYIH